MLARTLEEDYWRRRIDRWWLSWGATWYWSLRTFAVLLCSISCRHDGVFVFIHTTAGVGGFLNERLRTSCISKNEPATSWTAFDHSTDSQPTLPTFSILYHYFQPSSYFTIQRLYSARNPFILDLHDSIIFRISILCAIYPFSIHRSRAAGYLVVIPIEYVRYSCTALSPSQGYSCIIKDS